MVSIKEMESSVKNEVIFYFTDGQALGSFVESYEFEEGEDEEPMLLCSENLAVFQSELAKIEILERRDHAKR